MQIKHPNLTLLLLRLSSFIKSAQKPKQLVELAEDPRNDPRYQRQVAFLKENNIQEAYDCFQCQNFDFETDRCYTPCSELYGRTKQEIMCPYFNPPTKGKYVSTISIVNP